MMNGLINEIENAFQCSPVLAAFSVFDANRLPDRATELENYGTDEITVLASHYGQLKVDTYQNHRESTLPYFNEDIILREFGHFKFQMFLSRQRHPERQSLNLYTEFMNDDVLRASFPAMYFLVYLSQIIPSSTACVERVFSLMNSLCTPSRNRLSQSHLDFLMRICHKKRENYINDPTQVDNIIDRFRDRHERKIEL